MHAQWMFRWIESATSGRAGASLGYIDRDAITAEW
jgi:hypothetical protein